MADAVADYMAHGLSHTASPQTVYLNRRNAGRMAEGLGTVTLSALSVRQVEEWLTGLAERGWAVRTVGLARQVARQVLDHAARLGWTPVGRNVATLARLPQASAGRQRTVLTEQHVRALLAAAEGDWYHPLLALVAVTGCRIGEARALSWDRVDLDAGTVRLDRALRRNRDGGYDLVSPKAASARTVGIPAELTDLLGRHRRRLAAHFVSLGAPLPEAAFPGPDATFGENVLSRWLHKVADKAGVGLHGFHDLRHATATGLADDGVPLTRTAGVLGHRSLTTTSGVYTHATEAADAAVARGSRLLGG